MRYFSDILITGLLWGLSYAAAAANAGNPLEAASLPGVMGDTSTLYLATDGLYVSPLYNDSIQIGDQIGITDKMMTHASRIGIASLRESFSMDLAATWRFVTPVFKSRIQDSRLEHPLGIYADWLAVDSAFAKTWRLGVWEIKQQLQVGLSHLGRKGAEEVQINIHKIINTSWKHLDYSKQPKGLYGNVGAETALILPELNLAGKSLANSFGGGGVLHPLMHELYGRYNALLSIEHFWALAFELRAVRQLHSDKYEGMNPYRYEIALGALIFENFRPMVKLVSPILEDDYVGQVYFDLINFYLPL